jgi:N-acetyl-anhydromuramyl-L-alanine amidase AmpD
MADKPKITDLLLPDDQYVTASFDKVQIYIHHTASDGNPFEVQQYWISNKEAVSTAYLIGGNAPKDAKWSDGEIFKCFDDDKGGWHLGLKAEDLARGGDKHKSTTFLNMGSVGIEVCNWGGLTKNAKGNWVSYAGAVIPNDQVQEYQPDGWRGYAAYQRYTDAQIESLRVLLLYLCEKYKIDTAYRWVMWDIAPQALQGVNGIWTHISVRPANEKQDMHPQPNLCEMLLNLGKPK